MDAVKELPMRILITGSSGMLGMALCQTLSKGHKLIGIDIINPQAPFCKPQTFINCDILERKKIIEAIVASRPDAVIHTAAYADVDGCELNPEKAKKINVGGTKNVSAACQKAKAMLCYISTDFVFDGKKKTAYLETDKPRPINIYGQSKWEGELHIQSELRDFLIVRTSWLFGKGGKNFVDTILKKTREGKELKVVDDQIGSPTYAKDLAKGIKKLVAVLKNVKGIYHITNAGSCSWYAFASEIKKIMKFENKISPITSNEYLSPAKRPAMSILENMRYQEITGNLLRPWRAALRDYLT